MTNFSQKVKFSIDEQLEKAAQVYDELQEVKELLRVIIATNKPKSEWMTPAQLAEYLHVSKQWIYQRTRSAPNELPPIHRHGGKIVFSTGEVDQWVVNGGAAS